MSATSPIQANESKAVIQSSPISRLPFELLQEILFQAYGSLPTGWEIGCSGDIVKLALQVCHSWRTLVLSTPRFWSTIDLYASPFPLDYVQFSGDFPLSFIYSVYEETPRRDLDPSLWQAAIPYSSRIVDFEATNLTLFHLWALEPILSKGDWSVLKGLFIHLKVKSGFENPEDRFILKLEAFSSSPLEHIDLSGHFDPFRLRSDCLKEFVFTDVTYPVSPVVLLNFLEQCPHLKRCKVQTLKQETFPLEPQSPFKMPSLQEFSIDGFTLDATTYILQLVDAPNAQLEVFVDLLQVDDNTIDRLFPPGHYIHTRLASQTHHVISTTRGRSAISIIINDYVKEQLHSATLPSFAAPDFEQNGTFGIFIKHTFDPIGQALRVVHLFCRSFSSTHCTGLTILADGGTPYWNEITWRTIFDSFRALEYIRYRTEYADALAELLSPLRNRDPRDFSVVCPGLRALLAEDVVYDMEAMIKIAAHLEWRRYTHHQLEELTIVMAHKGLTGGTITDREKKVLEGMMVDCVGKLDIVYSSS